MRRLLLFCLTGFAVLTLALQSPARGDAGTPGLGWSLTREGETAKLAFGLPSSDHVALMMTCAPGDSAVAVYGDATPLGAWAASSGAEAPIDPLSGSLAESRFLALNDPSLRGLAERGRLDVLHGEARGRLTASTGDRRLVSAFMSYCHARPARG